MQRVWLMRVVGMVEGRCEWDVARWGPVGLVGEGMKEVGKVAGGRWGRGKQL